MQREERWGWFSDYPVGTCENDIVADACRRGATIRVLSDDGVTALVEYKGRTGSVTSQGLLEKPTPELAWGDFVIIKKKGTVARVTDVCWHFNQQRYFYYLEDLSGKPIKKRYFEDELRGA